MDVVASLAVYSTYKDRKFEGSQEEWNNLLAKSGTLYVGNLSFYTTEEQIYELFSTCGDIKRVIMGLDRNNKTPCGFCFVEYYNHDDALDCLKFINGTKLDERIIRTDVDPGFVEGRQFGRGRSGGQVRDEYRTEFDAGRGGYGAQERYRLERQREFEQRGTYDDYHETPQGLPETGVDAFGRSVELRSKRYRNDREGGFKRQRWDDEYEGF